MKENPSPKKWWFGQTFLYWVDSLDIFSSQEFLNLRYPLLVITGSEDFSGTSTDQIN